MDQNLKAAAEAGNVGQLYELIEKDGNVLRRFDEVEFIETPLHVAAERGCIEFAMEIMSLKPSLATKLNQRGLSPMHLAVEKGQHEMALRIFQVDKDLVRVRGNNGQTSLHYLCKVENQHHLLDRFMQACPESIRDATVQNRTALHIAVENNRPDVLRVLLRWLGKNDQYQEEVNRQDGDGNTALHIAASNNQSQMLKLLVESKADKYITNQAGLTALDVAHQSNNSESVIILSHCFIPRVSSFRYKLEKQTVKYVTKTSSLIYYGMDNISSDDRNALLVVLGLLLTATYQSTLSPPGGLVQSDGSSESTVGVRSERPGQSIMDQDDFLIFFIPTYCVFIVSYFLTLGLLKPFPQGFRTALQFLLSFLAISFDVSINQIMPNGSTFFIIKIFPAIVFIFMVTMCVTHKVSKLSVSILGSWIFLELLNSSFIYNSFLEYFAALTQGLLSFLFLRDEFWKGTVLVLGFSLFTWDIHTVDFLSLERFLGYPGALIGCWLFLHLGRFFIMRGIQYCNN